MLFRSINRGLNAERPVVILSENSLEHLSLAFGAMWAGVPHAPISTAYSLVSQDYGKLRHILANLTPGLVFASTALAAVRSAGVADRQMVFESAPCQVALKLQPGMDPRRILLLGQISAPATETLPIASIPIFVFTDSQLVAVAKSNEFGEFHTDIPKRRRMRLCFPFAGRRIEVELKGTPSKEL